MKQLSGWISLHRKIQEHWLYPKGQFTKYEAWLDILLMVNYEENKVMLGNELFTVKKGQRITSLRQLSERWGWSRNKVNDFLTLLENDEMIEVKKDTKKTVLTVVNYEDYQHLDLEKRTRKGHEKDTERTRKDTNNNDNNDNKDIYTIFEHWCSQGIIAHKKLNNKMRSHINARLQEHSLDELLKAIDNYKEVLTNDKYYWTHKWTLQDFMKPNNVVRFLDDSNPFQSFLKNKNDNVVHLEKQQPQGRYIPSGFDYEAAKSAGEDPDWWRQ